MITSEAVKTGFFKNSEDFFQKNRAIAQNSELPTSYLLEIIRNLSKALFSDLFFIITRKLFILLEYWLTYVLHIQYLCTWSSELPGLEVVKTLCLCMWRAFLFGVRHIFCHFHICNFSALLQVVIVCFVHHHQALYHALLSKPILHTKS